MRHKFSRAQRRHDYARIKAKRQYHWGYGHKDEWSGRTPEHAGEINYMSPRDAGFVASTPKPCGCWMCCSPRHAGFSMKEALTRQELKAIDKFEEELEYWEDYEQYDLKYGDTYYEHEFIGDEDDYFWGHWYFRNTPEINYLKWKYCNQISDEEYMWMRLKHK